MQSDGSVAQRCTRIEFSWSSALVEPVQAPDELDQIIIILGCLTGFAIIALMASIVYCLHVKNKCFWNKGDPSVSMSEEIHIEVGQSNQPLMSKESNNNNGQVQSLDPDENREIQDPLKFVTHCETVKLNKAGCFQVPVSIYLHFLSNYETFFCQIVSLN